MADTRPIYVCDEAFLRCAPWTPVTFRVQRNKIAKNIKDEESLFKAVKCLEAFGVRSDIDSVCAHLKTFKGSEVARRVFCNLRRWRQCEPSSLLNAVDLSVRVEGKHSNAYKAKQIFKGFLYLFLIFCKKLIGEDESLLEQLKGTFIYVFEGLTRFNFTLEPENNKKIPHMKKKHKSYLVYIVHCSEDYRQYYETMTRHLALLAPKEWGMYRGGNRYKGNYRRWKIPVGFRGFKLDTKPNTLRNWDAVMSAANIEYVKKPSLETVLTYDKDKRNLRCLQGRKRKQEETTRKEDEHEMLPLAKIVRKAQEKRRRLVAGSLTTTPKVKANIADHNVETNYGADHQRLTTKAFHHQTLASRQGRQSVTPRQREETSASRLREQRAIRRQGKQLAFNKTSLGDSVVEHVISRKTEQREKHVDLEFSDKFSSSSASSSADELQEQHPTPHGVDDASKEDTECVIIGQTTGAIVPFVSTGSASRVTCQPSFNIDAQAILAAAWRKPNVRRVVDSCIAKLIEQKCKNML